MIQNETEKKKKIMIFSFAETETKRYHDLIGLPVII